MFALLALCAMILVPLADVKGQVAPQGTLTVNKVIMGTTTASADDFSFLINNGSSTAFEADGSNDVTLSIGTYDVTEDPVAGYDITYSGCDNVMLTATNTPVCTITNTASTTNSTSTPTTTPTTGTLIVNKVVSGGSAATSSFSFRINGGATTTFETDGSNVIANLATGTYAVTEVPVANYTPTYSNCGSIAITAGATSTCTITNNFNVGGGQLYELTGIVWDDEDEDGVLDPGENGLNNWTVSAAQTGEVTRTDSTDSNGRYSLLVTDGDWSVTQGTQSNWDQTFPSGGSYTVSATGTGTTTIVLGDYNFGNDQDSSGGGGGNGKKIELTDNDNDDEDDDNSGGGRIDNDDDDDDTTGTGGTPSGQVLGEQTSVYPYGAPDTGFGGMSQNTNGSTWIPLLGMVLLFLLGFGVMRATHGGTADNSI